MIDGKVAFTGGVNLADEYINRIERFGRWKDTGIMIKGDAVRSFTLMFLQMWNTVRGSCDYNEYLGDNGESFTPDDPSGYVIPFSDCPLDIDKVGETVYMDILNRAGSYVHIMSPYLVLDGELEKAIRYAAERGVDVSLIMPGIPDKKLVYRLSRSYYEDLLKAGVKIYEYTPGFVHAKAFVSDDKLAGIGTVNLDYRSLFLHFECSSVFYKADIVKELQTDYLNTLEECRERSLEDINRKLVHKLIDNFLRVLAPLL